MMTKGESMFGNRITASIFRMRKQIADRLAQGLTTPADVKATHKDLDMAFGEFARFQTLKSVAVLEGTLTPEEGQTIYALLGETPTHFNRQDVSVKYVLTGLFGELLKAKLAKQEA